MAHRVVGGMEYAMIVVVAVFVGTFLACAACYAVGYRNGYDYGRWDLRDAVRLARDAKRKRHLRVVGGGKGDAA